MTSPQDEQALGGTFGGTQEMSWGLAEPEAGRWVCRAGGQRED